MPPGLEKKSRIVALVKREKLLQEVIVDSQLLDQSGLAGEGTAASLGDKLFYLFILLLSLIRLTDISWIPPVFPAVNLR